MNVTGKLSLAVFLYAWHQKSQRRAFAMDKFVLKATYQPTDDQPQAIETLVKGFREGNQCQTLLGGYGFR